MKTNTTPFTRNWASASFASSLRLKSLGLAVLTSLTLLAPVASAAVSLTPTENEPECVVHSGLWVAGAGAVDVATDENGPFLMEIYGDDRRFVLFIGTDTIFSLSLFYTPIVPPGTLFESSVGDYTYVLSVSNAGVVWSGSYSISEIDCVPSHGVPDSGSALALFACGLGAVGGVRHLMAKWQRA